MTPPGPVAADETDDLAGHSPVPATTPAVRRVAPNWPRRSGLRALRAALLRLAWLAGPLGRRAAGPPRTCSRMFPAIPSQAAEARRFAAAILDGHPAADDTILCLSELVSNSSAP